MADWLRLVFRLFLITVFSPLTGTSKVIPFCRPKDRYDSFFWRFSIADEAFMHAMVATISALQQDSLSRTERSSPRLTLSHVSRGLHLINKQLEFASSAGGSGESGQHKATEKQGDAVAVSDATIASILVLSMYERLRGDYARAAVHLRGLRHIVVDLRGGVADLRHTRGLASKICRADIDLALHFGTGTVFTAAEALPAMQLQQEQGGGEMSSSFPTAMPGPRLPRMEEENVDCYGVTAQLSPRYSELMRDLLRTTALLNSTAGAPVLDVYGLEALLVNLCYRIVELRPLRQSNAEATSSCRSGSKSASSSTNDVGTPHENYIDDRNTSFANNAGQPHMNNTASTTFSTAAATAASATGSGSSTVNTVSNIDDACHLGMAAFMTTLMLEFGGAQLVTHERLRASLGASIRRLSSSGVQSLRAALWLCFVGGVSVIKTGKMTTTTIRGLKASAVTSRQYGESRSIADSQNRSSRKYKNSGGHEEDGASDNDKSDVDDGVDDDTAWLLAQIHELSQDLGLDCPSPFGSPVSSWPSVLSVLSEFPWVHSLHDKPGQAIWDATCAMAAAAAAVAEAAVYSDAEADDQFLLRDDAPAGAGYAVDMLPCRGQVSLKLRPLQTLTHEPGVSLSHVKHGLW
ncbi:fungal specific transcription factor domain-containing protein [Microdochium nivale]|nr:fungal specific transcription factor domain-containing protein [Microdochium nivale]